MQIRMFCKTLAFSSQAFSFICFLSSALINTTKTGGKDSHPGPEVNCKKVGSTTGKIKIVEYIKRGKSKVTYVMFNVNIA